MGLVGESSGLRPGMTLAAAAEALGGAAVFDVSYTVGLGDGEIGGRTRTTPPLSWFIGTHAKGHAVVELHGHTFTADQLRELGRPDTFELLESS